MDDLKNHFLQRSIAGLQEAYLRLRDADAGVLLDTFRTLHTIKGTAQTFGFSEAANIAHKLEDMLDGQAGVVDIGLLLEGISLLIDSLEHNDPVDTEGFADKIERLKRDSPVAGNVFISKIPFETFDKFSDHERTRIFSASDAGRDIYRIEIAFDLADFATGFKEFRDRLDSLGETIATLPGKTSDGKIGFIIYFAAKSEPAEFARLCVEHSASLDHANFSARSGNALGNALSLIGKHGRELAADMGKKVEIIISVDDLFTGTDSTQLIFDALLHLLRNAIDHGFNKTGMVRIGITSTDNGLTITVADNGRGIDREKLRSLAAQKGLSADGDLADMIFEPGISTANEVSEISGRGVGLDAVKTMVENAGGSIGVKSETGKGTTFEIILSVPPAVAGG